MSSGEVDGKKIRVRRLHKFTMVSANGLVQPFYLNKFCDTTTGNRVRFMAKTNNQLTADDTVSLHMSDFIAMQDITQKSVFRFVDVSF